MRMTSSRTRCALPASALLVALLLPSVALAHAGHEAAGAMHGLLHPLTGLDHLLAMLAVGWWAAISQPKRWWAIPLVFALATLSGAVAGAMSRSVLPGMELPGLEVLIALSVVVFGVSMLQAWRAPTRWAMTIAATLGVAHGVAHGVELSGGNGAGGWLVGMAAATVLLHATGAAVGRTAGVHARWLTRVAGAATAAAGVALLVGAA